MCSALVQLPPSRGRAPRGHLSAARPLGSATLCCVLALAACGSESNPGVGGHSAGGSGGATPTGGSAGVGGTGGEGGVAPACAHAVCDVGDALDAGCDGLACVAAICADFPLCCSWLWAGECVAVVPSRCTGETCQPPPNSKFCDQLLAGHDSTEFCTSDDVSCSAIDLVPGESCDAFCNKLGTKCGAAELAQNDTCTVGGVGQCSDVLQGKQPICTCMLTCGEGPPCADGVQCQGGTTCAG